MNSRRSLTLVGVLALGFQACNSQGSDSRPETGRALAGASEPQASEPFAKAEVSNLIRQMLASEFTPEREVLVDLVEVPPNTRLERHWHPGEEFHYYLEGEPVITIEGSPTIHAKEGTIGHIPFQAEHVLSTAEKGARILVFRVHTAGEPLRHLVEE
jgi:quercetin dioxygenase-like cupin family protein